MSLGGSKLLPFKNDGGHCVLGDHQCCRHFLVPFPRSVPQHNPVVSSTDNSFNLMAWFLLWHALSTVGPYIDRCVPFKIMSNQLNLPQVDSNQVVETSQGWSMETGFTWAQLSLIDKGLNTYVNKVLLFFLLLIHLQRFLKTCFHFVIMGYCV